MLIGGNMRGKILYEKSKILWRIEIMIELFSFPYDLHVGKHLLKILFEFVRVLL